MLETLHESLNTSVMRKDGTLGGHNACRLPCCATSFISRRAPRNTNRLSGYVNIMPDAGEETQYAPNDVYNAQIHEQLRAMHEEWAGVPLERTSAFGIRVYVFAEPFVWSDSILRQRQAGL